jgi:two-component system, cell cycle response regulator
VARAPIVMIVSEQEWTSRSLDSILAPHGYAVMRAYNGRQAMERARGSNPDAVFIDTHLPDMEGLELCTRLRAAAELSQASPIILYRSGSVNREERLEALEAGAWDLLPLPFDAQELLLRLDRYMIAKREMDRMRESDLMDPSTGLYSWQGIVRRVREMGAAAMRFHRPMACIVVAPEDLEEPASAAEDNLSRGLAATLRSLTRGSDVLGRIGPMEFVVVAPDTNIEGAQILAERVRNAGVTADVSAGGARIRTGVYAVNDLHDANLDPAELLARATLAVRNRTPLEAN